MSLSAPFNWCDRLCRRCRLSPVCEVAEASKDAPADLVAHLTVSLERAVHLLEEVAAREGISMVGLPPPPPPGEHAERLLRAAQSVDRRAAHAVLLHAKIARIARLLDDLTDDLFLVDVVPNLFLVERLLDLQSPHAVAALRAELAPLFARVPAALRAAFETLVDARVAPSPFCVEEDPGRH